MRVVFPRCPFCLLLGRPQWAQAVGTRTPARGSRSDGTKDRAVSEPLSDSVALWARRNTEWAAMTPEERVAFVEGTLAA